MVFNDTILTLEDFYIYLDQLISEHEETLRELRQQKNKMGFIINDLRELKELDEAK